MRLFISYSTIDRYAIRELINALQSGGHEALYDLWLLPGQNWRQQTVAAIEQAEAVLYILTPESVASERCQWEIGAAVDYDKPVIPVRFHPDLRVPDSFGQCLDFSDGPTPAAVAQLMAQLYSLRPAARNGAGRAVRPRLDEDPLHDAVPAPPAPAMTPVASSSGASLAWQPGPARQTLPELSPRIPAVVAVGAMVLLVLLAIGVAAQELFQAAYLLGAPGMLVAAGLAFTLLRQQKTAVALLLGLEGALLTSASLYQVFTFGEYAAAAAALLLGYALGRTRLLLWPWLSLRLARQRREAEAVPYHYLGLLEQRSTAATIRLLDEPLAIAPWGSEEAMRALALQGVTLDEFVARTDNATRQRQYRQVVQQVALAQLEEAQTPEAVVKIAGLDALLPQESSAAAGDSWRVMLQGGQQAEVSVERLRGYARCLWQLQAILKTLDHDDRDLRRMQIKAISLIRKRIYQAVDPAEVADYWAHYDTIAAALAQLEAAGPPEAAETPRATLLNAVRYVRTMQTSLDAVAPLLPWLSAQERRWHKALQEIALVGDRVLATDYEERQGLLSREIARLHIIASSQPDPWPAINRAGAGVSTTINPWRGFTLALIGGLQAVQQRDALYVADAARQLSALLEQVDSIDAVAALEEALQPITGPGDSLGAMIEDTLQALIAIGNDVKAALSALAVVPGAHYHVQTLMDAHDKSNHLRNHLRTHYVSEEPLQWAKSIQGISLLLDSYLSDQSEREQGIYRNPYIVGNPIQQKNTALFKGRGELVQEITDLLRGDNRPTLVLYGPRRMGKTSFLLQLQNLLQGRGNFIPVFLDAQEPGSQQGDAFFFYSLARAIYVQMRRQPRGRHTNPPRLNEFESQPYLAINTWLEDEIEPYLNSHVLLVTIDEFERLGRSITEGRLSENVLDYMRHMMQHSPYLLFLFCGVETLDSLGPNAASYFINTHTIEISYLNPTDAEDLVRNPNPEVGTMPVYDDAVVADILRLTHCQPFLIQSVCSKIVDIANRQQLDHIDQPVLAEALGAMSSAINMYFKHIWDSAEEDGQVILRLLAAGPAPLPDDPASRAAGQRLCQRRVICRDTQDQWAIEIPLVQEWIQWQTQAL